MLESESEWVTKPVISRIWEVLIYKSFGRFFAATDFCVKDEDSFFRNTRLAHVI